MRLLRRLWHRLLFGSPPRPAPPRPTARPVPPAGSAARPSAARSAPADLDAIAATIREWVKPQPPRHRYRSREEVELALLMPWLTDAAEEERAQFLEQLLPNATKHHPWTEGYIVGEPREQCQQWGPLVLQAPEMMTTEGFCCLLGAELSYGLSTFCTSLSLLSRPVRMLWLLRQGRRAGQVFAALEQALGSRERALNYTWWVIADL